MDSTQYLVGWYLVGVAAPLFVEQAQQTTQPVAPEIVLAESHLAAVNRSRRIFGVDPSGVVRGPQAPAARSRRRSGSRE